MRLPLLLASALALAACTAHDSPSDGNGTAAKGAATASATQAPAGLRDHRARAIAGLPDRGQLLAYTAAAPFSRSAYTWHAIALSEDHALNAIASGTLDVPAPDGSTIALKFDHAVDHGDGNWTWVGRPAGTKPGTEAIITFGPKAVFGTVPYGRKPALRISSSAQGRLFLMETDPVKLARLDNVGRRPTGPDSVAPPPVLTAARDKVLARAAAQPKPQSLVASAAASQANTVDVVVGYTNGFATRFGGTSQAVTRLTHLVAVTNEAFSNSQINGAIRMVGTVQVTYPDDTNNQTALEALTGVTCTELDNGNLSCNEAPIPSALQPLVTARANLRADLMSLVRNFTDPENESCGIAWAVGSGEKPITMGDSVSGVSVISDSNGVGDDDSSGQPFPDNGYVCRNETFAHELAHNMGSAHDATTAAGVDGILTEDEHGRYPYSFGYKTDAGNFYTIMAYGDDGQQAFRVYSNPRISSCGTMACGTVNADNAQSLSNTIPIVASWAASLQNAVVRNDVNGDGKSDLLLRTTNLASNNVAYWLMNGTVATSKVSKTLAASFRIAATGDFNGDGRVDIVWTSANRDVRIWFGTGSGFGATPTTPDTFPTISGTYAAGWDIAGAGDIDGDGKSDLLFRTNTVGTNNLTYWIMNGSARVRIATTSMAASYSIAGLGDFNGDGKLDIAWYSANRDVRAWLGNGMAWGGTVATPGTFPAIVGTYATGWSVAGVGDVDGDGKSDLVLRTNTVATNNVSTWVMNGSVRTRVGTASMAASYGIAAMGDYNGDGKLDIVWTSSNLDVRTWLGTGTAFGGTLATPGSFPAITGTYTTGWAIVR
jgi:hypothetical protein